MIPQIMRISVEVSIWFRTSLTAQRALERNQWKKMVTARELGVDKNTLRRKIIRFDISPDNAQKLKIARRKGD